MHSLLEYVDVMKTFLHGVPIEITLVSHVNKSLVLLVKGSLVSHLLVVSEFWNMTISVEAKSALTHYESLTKKQNM